METQPDLRTLKLNNCVSFHAACTKQTTSPNISYTPSSCQLRQYTTARNVEVAARRTNRKTVETRDLIFLTLHPFFAFFFVNFSSHVSFISFLVSSFVRLFPYFFLSVFLSSLFFHSIFLSPPVPFFSFIVYFSLHCFPS